MWNIFHENRNTINFYVIFIKKKYSRIKRIHFMNSKAFGSVDSWMFAHAYTHTFLALVIDWCVSVCIHSHCSHAFECGFHVYVAVSDIMHIHIYSNVRQQMLLTFRTTKNIVFFLRLSDTKWLSSFVVNNTRFLFEQ